MSTYYKELNLLFIHVPRTGGTSIEQALFPLAGGHETVRDFKYVPEGVFKFAFVRNPWDRFVSGYFCREKVAGFTISVDGFNRYIEYIACKYPGEFPVFGVYEDHFRPMYHFLLDDNDKIGVDFVGRFESLQKDWDYVCGILGVTVELEHHRKFAHPKYNQCYTLENWDYIKELYRKDIELFGY